MISVLFMDCDGVLTTGIYLYDSNGKKYKEFSSVDSNAISEAQETGMKVEVISSDPTGGDINEARCRDMSIPYHRSVDEAKEEVAARRLKLLGMNWDDAAMIGDDVTDAKLLKRVRMPITVPNAVDEVQAMIKDRNGYMTERRGGRGAVAEAIRFLIREEPV